LKSDLAGLEISAGELRRLTGVDPLEVFRPHLLENSRSRWNFFMQELIVSLALTPILVGFLYLFVLRPLLGSSLPAAIVALVFMPIAIVAGRWVWRQRTTPTILVALLDDVDRYHATLKAIEIGDRLEAAGSSSATSGDRQTLISALQLTRNDLVRALQTERILRENQEFIATNPDVFANNLTTLQSLQVNQKASEYGQFLNEALQIGISIQDEMRKLQDEKRK
jgi:predicted lysophospholipase L1 biosynthesis ABC-type transport system permease subunit